MTPRSKIPIFPPDKLARFRAFLEDKGFIISDGPGEWELFRAWDPLDNTTHIVYANSKGKMSLPLPIYLLISDFASKERAANDL